MLLFCKQSIRFWYNNVLTSRALVESGQGFGIYTPKLTRDSRFEFQTGKDSGFKVFFSILTRPY